MAYQNINQYNFRRFGLKPVNEITDLCLASDEKDYDQEVIFSPLLIGEDDGNRMPFKFDFNSSGTTLCQVSPCVFSSDTIVSENYWNPTDTDPNFCPIVTNLCDVGLTGIDNGLVQNMSGETIQVTTGLYTNLTDKFSRYKYDRRMKLHPITGFTTTQNRLWNDNSYDYNLSYTNEGGDIGYVATLNGGFYQGFYKLAGYEYQVFPQRVSLGWTTEFLLKYRWTGNTDVGLNYRYPDNKGTFFYMGARAENKFYHYADGHPKQDSGYTRVTSGLTCMHTCGCASSANTSSDCLQVYQPSGGTITTCLCGCPCECNTKAQYPEKYPLYDEVSNAISLRLSGDTGSPRLCVKTYRITGGCESTGTCLTGLTYVTGTSVTEWCSTRGIFDDCSGTTYANIEHWVQIDTVFERYEWLDTCDLYDKGGLGLLVKDVYFATLEGRSVSLIEPPVTREQPYDPASTEVVTFTDMWTEEQKYRLGTLKFYVNGKLFMVAENFEEIIPRLLNVEKEKQIGVAYNISIGGGTQGLHDNLTFSGGCPTDLSGLQYQQDPECLTTYDLDHTIYSGLTTQIRLEELFGGSMIGDISAFRMYTEPLNAAQIKHNFKILKDKYDLLNPDCPNCRIPIPVTPTVTPSATLTPTITQTPAGVVINIQSYYSPGSIYAGYGATANTLSDVAVSVSFIDQIETSGTPINNPVSITIPLGKLTGFTQTVLNDVYSDATQISNFSGLTISAPGSVYTYGLTTGYTYNATPTPTPNPTQTPTPTTTETPTPTITLTSTETPTPTTTVTETSTQTPTPTVTETPTETPTPTVTETPTETPTPTVTETPTLTPTNTETPTNTPTSSITPTPSVTTGLTPTATPTQTATPTITPTITPTTTETPTNTPTETETPTPTVTETPTETPTNTPTETPTNTPTTTETPTPTVTETPTNTPTTTETQTPTPTVTNTETPTITPTNTPSVTPSVSNPLDGAYYYISTDSYTVCYGSSPSDIIYGQNGLNVGQILYQDAAATDPYTIAELQALLSTTATTFYVRAILGGDVFTVGDNGSGDAIAQSEAPCVSTTPTQTPTVTPTVTPTETPTNTPTNTVTPTITSTETPTQTPTNTVTPTITSTITPTQTPTNTVTSSITPTQTPTNSVTPTSTPVLSPSNTPTNTQTPTITPTITQTPTITPTNTITPTRTPTVTPSSTPASAPVPASTGLVAWYNIPATGADWTPSNPTNGTLIGNWNDTSQSIYGIHNMGADGGNSAKPTYTTNVQNGQPMLLFDGTANKMSATGFSSIAGQSAITMFIVSRFNSTTSPQTITTNATRGMNFSISGATSRYQIGMGSGIGEDSGSTVDTSAHVNTILFNGTATGNANRLIYRRDGVQKTLDFKTTTVGTQTNPTSTILYLGETSTGTELFNGYQGEIIIYNTVLTQSEILNTEKYLKNKWGTP